MTLRSMAKWSVQDKGLSIRSRGPGSTNLSQQSPIHHPCTRLRTVIKDKKHYYTILYVYGNQNIEVAGIYVTKYYEDIQNKL